MPAPDPTRLLGTYKTPRVRYGRTVRCEVRGEVEIVGMQEAPIPWPVGKRGRFKALVVCGDLARAVRREARCAVAQHWGVNLQTVWKWRKALGVGENTEGTLALHRALATTLPGMVAGLARAQEMNRNPEADRERLAKVSAALRGRPRPPEVREAIRRKLLGRKASAEARRKMSEANTGRVRGPMDGRSWTADEDSLVLTVPVAETMRRTGRTESAVRWRRGVLLKGGAASGGHS